MIETDGLLELEFRRGLRHALAEFGEEGRSFAREELRDLVDAGEVVLFRDLARAGSGAAVDMVVHAGRLARPHDRASAQGEEAFYEVEVGVDDVGAGKGAEVLASVVDDASGAED